MPLVLLIAAMLAQPAPAPGRDALFVGPEAGRGTGGDLRDRQDSAADLLRHLADSGVVTPARSAAEAIVVVDIRSRRIEDIAEGGRPSSAYVIDAVLRVGTYELPMHGRSSGMVATWRLAASDLGGDIERWIKDNQAALAAPIAKADPSPRGAPPASGRAGSRRLPDRPAVYCAAALEASGFVDKDLGARRDSAADLAKALARDANVEIVDAADKADVVVEILERTQTRKITGTRYTKTGPAYTTTSTSFLRARVRAGGSESVLEGRSGGFTESWRAAAGDLARKVAGWVASAR